MTTERVHYKSTLWSCYLGYITQAVVNCLLPLLFIIFQTDYNPDAIEAFAQLSKEHGFIREIPEQDFLYAKIEKGEEK